MNDIKFSVLIPVYNVEKYLPRCIDSVLHQDYNNIELVLVDDGSTDDSGIICDEYASKDSRIKVIHKKNEGVYIARKVAASYATGDYCLFVDSDDYWDEDLLKHISAIIKKYGCDMVLYNFRHIYPNCVIENDLLFPFETVIEGKQKKVLYQLLLEGNSLSNLVLKVVSINIVKGDVFQDKYNGIKKGEDALQGAEFLINAKRVVYLPKTLYNYRMGVGVTKQTKVEDIISVTRARQYIFDLLQDVDMDLIDSFAKSYYNYMKYVSRYVVCGYIDDKLELKQIFKKIINTDYYKCAKLSSYSKLSKIERFIIFVAEKETYFILRIIAYILRVKRYIRNL